MKILIGLILVLAVAPGFATSAPSVLLGNLAPPIAPKSHAVVTTPPKAIVRPREVRKAKRPRVIKQPSRE